MTPPQNHRQIRSGMALVVTLAFLTMVTILIVGFALSMRTERMAAGSMAENARAKLIADSALVHAISLLRDNIPDPGDPTVETPVGSARNWFTNPGRLTIIDPSDPPNVTEIPLYSGEASSANPAQAANLNAASPTTGKYPITGSNDPMWVSWINVLKDAAAPAGPSNKLVGRYAFWIDDESTKINFNVARGKPEGVLQGSAGLPSGWKAQTNGRELKSVLTPTFPIDSSTYSLSDPAGINLDALGVDVVALQQAVASNGFFVTPEAIKQFATGDPEAFFESQKFNLTPFSRSPEFNVFGKSRIYMAKSPTDLTAGPMYQHFSHKEQPTQFYGDYSSVGNNTDVSDAAGYREMREAALFATAKYLNRDDWPGMGKKKFRWVSGAKDKEECDQIALNLATMGWWGTTRTSGISNILANHFYRYGVIGGAYASPVGPNGSMWKGPLSNRPMLPFSMAPRITEIVCDVKTEAVGSQWYLTFAFAVEFYLPPGGKWDEVDDPDNPGSKLKVYRNNGSNNSLLSYAPTYCSITATSPALTISNSFKYSVDLASGQQLNGLKTDIPAEVPLDDYTFKQMQTLYVSTRTDKRPIRSAEGTGSRAKFNSFPIEVTVKLRCVTGTRNGMRLIQAVPGPVPVGEGGDSEMQASDAEATIEFPFVINSPSDLSYSMEVTDARLSATRSEWKPHPIIGDDSLGMQNAQSTGFNDSAASQWAMWNWDTSGYRVNSIGMFGFVPTGMQRGEPWETLRLHEYTVGGSEIPDWAVLDLVAPNFPSPISQMNSTAGRINLNSKIFPADSPHFNPPERIEPLKALFKNLPNGDAVPEAIVSYQENGGFFDYIGRVCEVPKVADDSLGDTEFEKEVLLRNLASLFTTQSNTFGVWGVAQTIKKKPSSINHGIFESGDVVTGEKRFYAVVERYVWPGRDGTSGSAEVDSAGVYSSTADGNPTSPGKPPDGPWDWANVNPRWALVDGPHAVGTMPGVMGTFPYLPSDLGSADNPLAALMKYRILHFTYVD